MDMSKSTFRRLVVGVLAAGAITVGMGAAATTATPDQSDRDREAIARLDAESRERDPKSDTLQVVDHATGKVVEMSKAEMFAEQRRADKNPAFQDSNGNPRYMLVWENGKLVPGPELVCQPNPEKGEPDICTPKE